MNELVRFPTPKETYLLPSEGIRLIVNDSPIGRKKPYRATIEVGKTVQEIIEEAIPIMGTNYRPRTFCAYIVTKDKFTEVPKKYWTRVRPKKGVTLLYRPLPRGFIAAIIAGVSSVFGSISGVLGGLGIIGKLVMAAIGLGIKFLLGQLFKPKEKKIDSREPDVGYTLNGSRNQLPGYGVAIPLILGEHRITPPYAAPPYTKPNGNDQDLHLLFVNGYGPLRLRDPKIGETPTASFDDVQVEDRFGFSTTERTALYPQNVTEFGEDIELTAAGGYQTRETTDGCTVIEIDVVCPNGLAWYNDKGTRYEMGCSIQWRYRKKGTVPYTVRDEFFKAATVDTVRQLFSAVPSDGPGRYEVGVLRNFQDYTDSKIVSETHWTALRGYRTGEPVTEKKPICVTAIVARATGQLNGTLDTYNVIAGSLVTAWNGSSWVANQFSNNPADLFRHILTCAANNRPVALSKIDLTSLQSWWGYCLSSGWTYNKPLIEKQSVLEVLFEICAAGRAVPIWKDGKWSVIWDERNVPTVQLFTPRNSWNFELQHNYKRLVHALRVTFPNEDKRWQTDELLVYNDGYNASNATIIEGYTFPGVTDSKLIWKHARYQLASFELRPAQYTLVTGIEALILTRWDKVRVMNDVMKVGLYAGRVKSTTAGPDTITIDTPVTLQSSSRYMIRFRTQSGPLFSRDIVPGTSGLNLTTLPLVGTGTLPGGSEPNGAIFTIGETELDSNEYRVSSIEPQEEGVFRLTLVDFADGIYDADTGSIPDFDPGITDPVDPYEFPPTNVLVTDYIYNEGSLWFEALHVSWVGPTYGKVLQYQVRYADPYLNQWQTAGSVDANTYSFDIPKLNTGIYTVGVRAIFKDGHISKWVYSQAINANKLGQVPPDVTDFDITTSVSISTLTWRPVVITSQVTYEVRFAPSGVVSPTWNTATLIAQNIAGTILQVPTRVGTYFIKAVLPTGVSSANATSIQTAIASLQGLNAIATITDFPDLLGTYTNTERVDGTIRLLGHNVMSNWATLSSVTSLYFGDGASDSIGFFSDGYYQFASTFDLGAVYTSKLSALVDALGFDPTQTMDTWTNLADLQFLDTTDASQWFVRMEYRATNDNPAGTPTWSAWTELTAGDASARAFQFRLHLQGIENASDPSNPYAVVTPSVRNAIVTIDMEDRHLGDNNVAIPNTGLVVAFNPPLRALKGFATNNQNLATGDYFDFTVPPSTTGFTVFARNAAGTAISGRKLDWAAVGYGSAT